MKKSKKKFINNMVWLITEKIIQMIISVIIGALSARYLGPSNFGLINYSLSIINIFIIICGLGLDSIVIKEFLLNKYAKEEIIGTVIVLRLLTSLISIFCIFCLINRLNPDNNILLVISFIQSLSLIFKSFDIIEYWFQSKLESRYVVISKSIATILVGVFKVFLLIIKASVQFFAFSTLIESMVIAILLLLLYSKKEKFNFYFKKEVAKYLLNQSYHFILSGLLVTIYTQIDKIMLGKIIDDYSVGIYTSAISICNIWYFIPGAIINSATPLLLELSKTNKDLYIKRLKLLYSVIIWMGILVSIIFLFLAKPLVYIMYGAEYLQAVNSVKIISWSSIFAFLGTARGIWIVTEGYNKYVKYYIGFGAMVNVLLNFILIKYIGISGAAIATLIAQFCVAIIGPLFIKSTRLSSRLMIEAFIFKDLF